MLQENLIRLRVAILDDGFEQAEMEEPRKALDRAGAKTTLISPQAQKVKDWHMKEGRRILDRHAPSPSSSERFRCTFASKWSHNPDKLPMQPKAVEL
jgi:protease I